MKQKLVFFLALLCFGSSFIRAQNAKIADNKWTATGKHSPLSTITLSGEAGTSPDSETGWNIVFMNIYDKEEGNEKLETAKNSYPEKKYNNTSAFRTEQTSTATLQKGRQFDTNIFDGSFPPDNSAAVSKGGYVVSIVNANITVYDTVGNMKQTQSIISFVNDTTLKDVIYDPYIIYDPEADRFYLVESHGLSASTADLLLFSSKTNNPLDGWYYYKIPIGKNSPGYYSDYSKVAVSDSNIYITTNLINVDNNFDESVIYQVDKKSINNGGTLKYMFWNGIHDNQGNTPFTLIPAPSPQSGSYGEGMYFASVSDGSGASKIQIFHLTNDLSNSPQIIPFHVNLGSEFSIGSNAVQPGTSPQLDVGDCRIKGAFYLTNIIHCVFTIAIDNNAGYNGILYARINTVNFTVQTQTFGLGDRDIAYPSLAWVGADEYDKSVAIFYDESGANIFPGTEAIICDDVMNFNAPLSIKQGVAPIIIDNNPVERWGDFSSTCRANSNGLPTVWSFGIYGSKGNVYGNNMCEMRNTSKPDTGLGNNDVKVYPNPFTDNCTIKINNKIEADASFDLYDSAGKLVKHFPDEHLLAGEYVFGFSRKMLSSGIYHLVISSGHKTIIYEELVVQ